MHAKNEEELSKVIHKLSTSVNRLSESIDALVELSTLSTAPTTTKRREESEEEKKNLRKEENTVAPGREIDPSEAPGNVDNSESVDGSLNLFAEPPLTPAAKREQTKIARMAESESLFSGYVVGAVAEGNDRTMTLAYFHELFTAFRAHYERKGGSFTPTRMRNFMRRISNSKPYAALAAAEVYIDGYAGTRDERYMCSIAERLTKLPDGKIDAELGKHRAKADHKTYGLYARLLQGDLSNADETT